MTLENEDEKMTTMAMNTNSNKPFKSNLKLFEEAGKETMKHSSLAGSPLTSPTYSNNHLASLPKSEETTPRVRTTSPISSLSLLLSLQLLPLQDLVHCSQVCQSWNEYITMDSQKIAWRLQKEQERRKYLLAGQNPMHSDAHSIAEGDSDEYGVYNSHIEHCRSIILRATPSPYFLRCTPWKEAVQVKQRRKQSLLVETDEKKEVEAEEGSQMLSLERAESDGSSSEALEGPSSIRLPPLLSQIRCLILSIHGEFSSSKYVQLFASFQHLTNLSLIITNLYALDAQHFKDAFRLLAEKRNQHTSKYQLWELEVDFMQVSEGTSTNDSSGYGQRMFQSKAPNYLAHNFYVVRSAIRHLCDLRFLRLIGVKDAMDTTELSWLGKSEQSDSHSSEPLGSPSGASPSFAFGDTIPCFPELIRLELPGDLSPTMRRVYSVRKFAPQLKELVWEGNDRTFWPLLIGVPPRPPAASADLLSGPPEDEEEKKQELLRKYVPPPMRLPAPPLHSLQVESTNLPIEVFESVKSTLRSLALEDNRPVQLLPQKFEYLKSFTDGVRTLTFDQEVPAFSHESPPPSASAVPAANNSNVVPNYESLDAFNPDRSVDTVLESLSITSTRWTFIQLAAFQALGRWIHPLKRLRLCGPLKTGERYQAATSTSHCFSVTNSTFHPHTFFEQLGVHNSVESLFLESINLTILDPILPSSAVASLSLHTLVLRNIMMFQPRGLHSIKHAAKSLKYLTIDSVENVLPEDLIYLVKDEETEQRENTTRILTETAEASSSSSSVATTASSSSSSSSSSSTPKLQLERLYFSPFLVTTRPRYIEHLNRHGPSHPFVHLSCAWHDTSASPPPPGEVRDNPSKSKLGAWWAKVRGKPTPAAVKRLSRNHAGDINADTLNYWTSDALSKFALWQSGPWKRNAHGSLCEVYFKPHVPRNRQNDDVKPADWTLVATQAHPQFEIEDNIDA